MAPRPCAFIFSRARSSRYLRNRSQLMRSCQSNPTEPTFAKSILQVGTRRVRAPLESLLHQRAPGSVNRSKGLILGLFQFNPDQSKRFVAQVLVLMRFVRRRPTNRPSFTVVLMR